MNRFSALLLAGSLAAALALPAPGRAYDDHADEIDLPPSAYSLLPPAALPGATGLLATGKEAAGAAARPLTAGQFTGRLRAAERKMANGRYSEARGDLLRLLPEATTEARLYRALGECYFALGQFDFALEALRRVDTLEADPRVKRESHRLFQKAEVASRRHARTLVDADGAASGGAVTARAKSGRLFEAQGDYASAFGEYAAIARDYPNHATGFLLSGTLHLALGEREPAVREFRSLFAVAPQATAAVEVLTRHGFSPEECAAFGYTGKPDYGRIENEAAEAEFRRGLEFHLNHRPEATRTLEHAVALNPDHLRARLWLARQYYATGDLDNCFNTTLDVLRLDAKSWAARELRYDCFSRWGYPDEALKELEDGLAADTDAVRLRLLRGLHLLPDRARKMETYAELKRTIELDPYCKEAADALAAMGLSFNRVRALGYKGIQLPVKYAMKDKYFIPREKKNAQYAEMPPMFGVPRADDFAKKGRAARRQRLVWRDQRIRRAKHARKTGEVELTGEVRLLTGEVALAGTGEARLAAATAEVSLAPVVEPIHTLEEVVALVGRVDRSPERRKSAQESARRVYPKLDDKGKRAYWKMYGQRAGAPATGEVELGPAPASGDGGDGLARRPGKPPATVEVELFTTTGEVGLAVPAGTTEVVAPKRAPKIELPFPEVN